MNRRAFTKLSAAAAAGLAAGGLKAQTAASPAPADSPAPFTPRVHLFSKHIQFLDYPAMAKAAREMGFDGLDLTVRPRGHVEPENVATDLPKAVEAIQSQGLAFELMTTAITDPLDPTSQLALQTAAKLGLSHYRMGYFRFPDEAASWTGFLDECRPRLLQLAELNQSLGIHGAYQNHAGSRYVGAYIPDLLYLLDGLDSRWIGSQYDIRHATVEGGHAWPLGLRFIAPYIQTIVVKDFFWESSQGSQKLRNVPLGEGVVDFATYFQQLRQLDVQPVVSLHAEYDLGGAQRGSDSVSIDQAKVFDALSKDLQTFHRLWRQHSV